MVQVVLIIGTIRKSNVTKCPQTQGHFRIMYDRERKKEEHVKAFVSWYPCIGQSEFYLCVNEVGRGFESFSHEDVTWKGEVLEILQSRDLWTVPKVTQIITTTKCTWNKRAQATRFTTRLNQTRGNLLQNQTHASGITVNFFELNII